MCARPRTRLHSLAEVTDRWLVTFDEERRIRLVSAGLAKLIGPAADDLIGRRAEFLSAGDPLSSEAIANALCPPPEVFAGQRRVTATYLPDRTGRRVGVELHHFPLTDGEAISQVVTFAEPLAPGTANSSTGTLSAATAVHAELAAIRLELRQRYNIKSLIGTGPRMGRVFAQLQLARQTGSRVLVLGEPGVGKEHFARVLHQDDDGPSRSFVPIGCRELPKWELKPIVKRLLEPIGDDSPTTASLRPKTVFLGDVEAFPRDLQTELVTAFTPTDHPTGANNRAVPAWRLIAGSTRSLAELRDGEDLLPEFIELVSPLVVELPPLRERPDDLLPLAQFFLERANPWDDRQIGEFSTGVIEAFRDYHWPGNVRELAAVVGEARSQCETLRIETDDLPFAFRTGRDDQIAGAVPIVSPILPLDELLERVERDHIQTALTHCDGNRTEAAKLLGIPRAKLYRRLESLGLAGSDG